MDLKQVLADIARAIVDNPDAVSVEETVEDVNRLLKQFDQMKKLMKQFSGKRGMRLPGMGRLGGV